MKGFPRNIKTALDQSYDVIVVGAGIYGMTLTLEAARRGLRPLLLEKADFGGGTSLNSLRILHGGLRYLQNMDLPRFFESVRERNWFMENFRPLCHELPCLMPLYGKGLKRPLVFHVALCINNALSKSSRFAEGRVLSVAETRERFPEVRREGLQGSALWYDGQILSPQRLHAELLRWAADRGATLLNYVDAARLVKNGNKVSGMATAVGVFKAPIVINAAGPWAREVASALDRDHAELMTPSLTFNLLLDVSPPSDAAVAVQAASRVYFVTPHRAGLTFVGTVHHRWIGSREPTEEMVGEFLDDLNKAIPGWDLRRSNVLRVTAGVLPAKSSEDPNMAHRSTFVKHDIEGLFSTCGIKYTTARGFAEWALDRIFGKGKIDDSRPLIGSRSGFIDPEIVMALGDDELSEFMAEESVTRAEDLLERRIDWIVDGKRKMEFAGRVTRLLSE